MNKQAIEGFPFRMVVVALIMILVFSIAFVELSTFKAVYAYRAMSSDLSNIIERMESLKVGGYNSFSYVQLNVASGYLVFFSNESNAVLITNGINNTSISLPAKLSNALNLSAGSYVIELYYGDLALVGLKNYTLVFT